MTDLEITKLCAEAVGVWHCPDTDTDFVGQPVLATTKTFDPLHDDAQAMTLVKKFRLRLNYYGEGSPWSISSDKSRGDSEDLNRAICECVAKMQKGKE